MTPSAASCIRSRWGRDDPRAGFRDDRSLAWQTRGERKQFGLSDSESTAWELLFIPQLQEDLPARPLL
jgi:hypothetical protein